MTSVQNTGIQAAGALPKRMPPPSLSPIKQDPNGTWTWDPTWYMWLYNIQHQVLGTSGTGPAIIDVIASNTVTTNSNPVYGVADDYFDDWAGINPGLQGPAGPPGSAGTPGPRGDFLKEDTEDADLAALSMRATLAAFLAAPGPISLATPFSVTGTTYTMGALDSTLIFNPSAACTVTLLPAGGYPGRILFAKNITAFAIASASSNVVPRASATPGTAFLAGVAGTAAMFQSDGTNWVQIL